VQQPLPIIVGGHTPPAYRRAVARGHGWYGFALTPETAARSLAGLRDAASRVERPADLGRLEITVTPRGHLTRESVDAFAALGVDRLVPFPAASPSEPGRTIETAAALAASR
jgi:alkanesulfonate monooxygenase SsuD/methylene tetrahydromethanopterin reductase-like flavin-dependent oxidoreductase (luciferase family)